MSALRWHEPRPRVRQHDAVAALSDAGNQVIATLREWRRRMRERNELAGLDDRMLQDIGLTRRRDAHHASSPPHL